MNIGAPSVPTRKPSGGPYHLYTYNRAQRRRNNNGQRAICRREENRPCSQLEKQSNNYQAAIHYPKRLGQKFCHSKS